ncbi:interleukin-17D [Gouania willdenowi]|nr:interleukin-17D [Gouania willdenowi]
MAPKMSVLFFLFSVLLLTVAALQQSRFRKKSPRTRSCLDLPEEILEQMFGRMSVGVMSAFHHALQLQTDTHNLSCPSSVTQTDSKSRLPVNLLSVSPWAYRITYDPARYPRSIPEAYCLCKGCLIGPHGENEEHRSTPIYTPSVILRRTGSCAGGRYSYSEVYVSIAVGCTCVPRLQKERDRLNNNNQSPQGLAKTRQSAGNKV